MEQKVNLEEETQRFPLFSILIANYNNGRYIQEAVESVLKQSYPHWEIILVDDGSTDESLKFYQQYEGDKHFHIFYNKKNMGCGYTKRRCIELASGEYCGFLDPDDRLDSFAIERMVAEYERRPRCAIVYSSTYKWDDQTDMVSTMERVGAIGEDEDYLISMTKSIFHFAVFKKKYYDLTEGIDASLRTGVDLDLYLKLEEVGDLFYVDIPLYYYRQNNPNSISGIGKTTSKKQLNINHYKTTLNAFQRRIKTKSPLFEKNKARYLSQMRWSIGQLWINSAPKSWPLLRYSYWYWVGSSYSMQALNHLRKILFMSRLRCS